MPKKIAVLKVPQRAFDPARPPSSLLLSQVHQLQAAVFDAIDSEGEAARCIRTLTLLLEELRPQIAPRAHKDTAVRARRRTSPRRVSMRTGPRTRTAKKR